MHNFIFMPLVSVLISSVADVYSLLRDSFKDILQELMEAEMDDHLGYERSERSDNEDYRNGYKRKRVNSSYGTMEIEVSQDRKSTILSGITE